MNTLEKDVSGELLSEATGWDFIQVGRGEAVRPTAARMGAVALGVVPRTGVGGQHLLSLSTPSRASYIDCVTLPGLRSPCAPQVPRRFSTQTDFRMKQYSSLKS